MNSHLRFATAVVLVAFASLIAFGALKLLPPTIDKVRAAATTPADAGARGCSPPLDRDCLPRRDLPWIAAPRFANAGPVEIPPVALPAPAASSVPPDAAVVAVPLRAEAPPEPALPPLRESHAAVTASPEPRSELAAPVPAPPPPTPQLMPPPDEQVAVPPAELTPRAVPPSLREPPAPRRAVVPPAREPAAPRKVIARAHDAQDEPTAEERHGARPASMARSRAPTPRQTARREPAAKPAAHEALSVVRKFGDTLRGIPVNSYAADGTPRRITIRPTSVQDVYYYSVPR